MTGRTSAPVVPGWTILGRLGAGAMGTVWKARRADGTLAAIKIAKALTGVSDGAAESMFRREALACLNVDHPNLVRGLDVGTTADGRPYLALEFVEGRTLARVLLDDGPVPEAHVVAIAAALARGLEHAHRMGLLHRDVKPSNVMILPDGGVKLLDLGLVAETSETPSGSHFVTRAFCAPEAFDASGCGPRSDLFSLGATLAAALIGTIPDTPGVWDDGTLPESVGGVPLSAGLRAVVERLVRSDPAQRYASAAELGLDLDALAAGERPLGAILGAGAVAVPRTKQARAAVALALAVVAVVTFDVVMIARRADESPPSAEPRATNVPADPARPAPGDGLAAARTVVEHFPDDFVRMRQFLDRADTPDLSADERAELSRLREGVEIRFTRVCEETARDRQDRAAKAADSGDVARACAILRDWPVELADSPHRDALAQIAATWQSAAQTAAVRLAGDAEALETSGAVDPARGRAMLVEVAAALGRTPFDGDERERLRAVETRLLRDVRAAEARALAEEEAAAARARAADAMAKWRSRVAATAVSPDADATRSLLDAADDADLPPAVRDGARRILAAADRADAAITEALQRLAGKLWAGPVGTRLVVEIVRDPPDASAVLLSPQWTTCGGSAEAVASVAGGRDLAAAWLFVHGEWAAAAGASGDIDALLGDAARLPSAGQRGSAGSADELTRRDAFTWRPATSRPDAPAGDPVLAAWAAAIAGRPRPAPSKDPRAAAARSEGRDAFLRDELDVAWARLNDAAVLDPWNAEVAALRGRVALVGARTLPTAPALAFAFSEGRRAADLDPKLPAGPALAADAGIELCAVASAALQRRALPFVAAACEDAANSGREDPRYLAFAGDWHLAENRAERATALLRRAVAKAPASSPILLSLARAELAAGRKDRARDALQRAGEACNGALPESAEDLIRALEK